MPVSKSKVFVALLSVHSLLVLCTIAAMIYTATIVPWSEPWMYIVVLTLFTCYYYFGGVLEMRVYRNDSVVHHRILSSMQCLRSRYRPTPYLINANLQTLFAAAGRPTPAVKYERELASGVYPDGEICRLDWSMAAASRRDDDDKQKGYGDSKKDGKEHMTSSSCPVVIVFHGLTGGSDDSNMHYVTQIINRQLGWDVVIPVRRGCGDDPTITVPKFYAYGGLEDTAYVVDYIATKMHGRMVLGVGISAGSNILTNYLGTYGNRSRIQGAISIANGYCWDKGTRAIRDHHPVWDAVMSGIVYHTLFRRHVDVFDHHEKLVVSETNNVGGLHELNKDDALTTPMGGISESPTHVANLEEGLVDLIPPESSNLREAHHLPSHESELTAMTPSSSVSDVDHLEDLADEYPTTAAQAAIAAAAKSSRPLTPQLQTEGLRQRKNVGVGPAPRGGSSSREELDEVLVLKRVGSQREVDEAVSRRLHGFASLEAFYRHQSCEYRLHNVAVPTVFLNALDDPLAHHLNIPRKALQRNPYTLLVTTACGGHLGWSEGWWPFVDRATWMDRFIAEALHVLNELAQERRHGVVHHPHHSSKKGLALLDSPLGGMSSSFSTTSSGHAAAMDSRRRATQRNMWSTPVSFEQQQQQGSEVSTTEVETIHSPSTASTPPRHQGIRSVMTTSSAVLGYPAGGGTTTQEQPPMLTSFGSSATTWATQARRAPPATR